MAEVVLFCLLFLFVIVPAVTIVVTSIVLAILYRFEAGYWPRWYLFKFWED